MQRYRTVNGYGTAEIVVKKSRFLASVFPAATEVAALASLEQIRKEHRKANHNVYAFSAGTELTVIRSSDDGEPAGTAGAAVLEVIRQEALQNTLIVVTRYFGGTLLGAGGLFRAYGQAAKRGIEAAGTVYKVLHQQFAVEFAYGWLGKIQNYLLGCNCVPGSTSYTDIVRMEVMVPKDRAESFRAEILELTNGRTKIEVKGETYLDSDD